MNRRFNSVLFIVGATVANIVVMFLLFILLLVLYARLAAPHLAPTTNQFMLLVLFIGSVVATYIMYHQVMKALMRRYDLTRYFGPLFRGTGEQKDR